MNNYLVRDYDNRTAEHVHEWNEDRIKAFKSERASLLLEVSRLSAAERYYKAKYEEQLLISADLHAELTAMREGRASE